MCDLLVETLHERVKSIIIQKSSQITKSEELLIGNNVVEIISSVKLLENYIDDQLNFNLHISNICKSVPKQFNALLSLKCSLRFQKSKVLINGLILSDLTIALLFGLIISEVFK